MQQGRRTASLKASYEAVSKSVDLTKELTLGRELAISKMQQSTSSASAAAASDLQQQQQQQPVPVKQAGRSKK